MSDRKQSPDVLAELLGAELPPSPEPALEPVAPAPRAPAAKPPRRQSQKTGPAVAQASAPSPEPVAAVPPPRWETEIVTFQHHRDWRPRYVNGVELKNWLTGPLIHDYLGQRGAEGWELAGTSAMDRFYGAADNLQLYFKRRR